MISFAIQRTIRSKFSWEKQFIWEKDESWDLFKNILPETKKKTLTMRKKEYLPKSSHWLTEVKIAIKYNNLQQGTKGNGLQLIYI